MQPLLPSSAKHTLLTISADLSTINIFQCASSHAVWHKLATDTWHTLCINYNQSLPFHTSADNSTVSVNIVYTGSRAVWHKLAANTWQSWQRVEWEWRHQWRAAADAAEWCIDIITATAAVGSDHLLTTLLPRVECRGIVGHVTSGLDSRVQLLQPMAFVQLIISNQSVWMTGVGSRRHTERVVTCWSNHKQLNQLLNKLTFTTVERGVNRHIMCETSWTSMPFYGIPQS